MENDLNDLELEFDQAVGLAKDKLMEAQLTIKEAIELAKDHKFWLNKSQMRELYDIVNNYERVRSWVDSGCAEI